MLVVDMDCLTNIIIVGKIGRSNVLWILISYICYYAEWLILFFFSVRVRSLTCRTVVSSVASVSALWCHRKLAVIQWWDLNSATSKGWCIWHLICNMSGLWHRNLRAFSLNILKKSHIFVLCHYISDLMICMIVNVENVRQIAIEFKILQLFVRFSFYS
jgi:hypothetical protein